MKKLTEIVAKNVLCLEVGQVVGYVLKVVFDSDELSVAGIVVVDNESEQEFFVDSKNFKICQDVVIIKNIVSMQNISCQSQHLIGLNVYSDDGVDFGKIKEIYLKNNKIFKIKTSKCEFLPKNIQKIGENCLIFGNKKKKVKVLFELKSRPIPKVMIQENKKEIKSLNQEEVFFDGEKPMREYANLNSIIGKVVTQNILGLNNELVARKGDKINKNIISKAKMHNKLNLLMIYCC